MFFEVYGSGWYCNQCCGVSSAKLGGSVAEANASQSPSIRRQVLTACGMEDMTLIRSVQQPHHLQIFPANSNHLSIL